MRDPTSAANPRSTPSRAWNKPTTPKKINRRALILALVLGVVAAVLIVAYLGSRDVSSDQPVVPMELVVVAARDIPAGKKITESMVELKELPTSAVLGNPARSKSEVVGQALRYPVAKGDQLDNLRLLEAAKVQILSFQIPPGLRGFTIPVDVSSTPAALTAPGDFVDVLVSGPLAALRLAPQLATVRSQSFDGDSKATLTLLQNVQVIAVQREYVDNGVPYDSSVRGQPPEKASVGYVTLALTPEQGQMLRMVGSGGAITLSLRPFGDNEPEELEPTILLQVVVAAQDIAAGQKVTESMVQVIALPESAVIQNAATPMAQVVGQYLRNPVTAGEQLSRADLQGELQVVVASRDIAVGQKITESMVELTALPESAVIQKATTSMTQVLGQYLRNPVGAGEQLSRTELANVQPLSLQIPQGLRALTIPVEVTTTPVALVVPGDYVDVLAALDIISLGLTPPPGLEDEDLKGAVTLFQNLRVLAVSREYLNQDLPYDASVRGALPEESNSRHMTLAVTPEQAQLLWLAIAKEANITVTLRPYGDDETIALDLIAEPLQLLP